MADSCLTPILTKPYKRLASSGIDSLLFLSARVLLFPQRQGRPAHDLALNIYEFDAAPLQTEEDLDVRDKAPQAEGGRVLASLQFPGLVPDVTAVTRCVARCEPSLSYREKHTQRTPTMQSPEKTFRPSAGSRIVTLSFETLRQVQERLAQSQYTVIFHADAVKKIALGHHESLHLDPRMPWEDWGENNTRWFPTAAPPHWICYSYGSRIIRRKPNNPLGLVQILDFSQSAVFNQPQGTSHNRFNDSVDVVKVGKKLDTLFHDSPGLLVARSLLLSVEMNGLIGLFRHSRTQSPPA